MKGDLTAFQKAKRLQNIEIASVSRQGGITRNDQREIPAQSQMEEGNEDLITRNYPIETGPAEEWIETRILWAGRLHFEKDDLLNGFGANSFNCWREGFLWERPFGEKSFIVHLRQTA